MLTVCVSTQPPGETILTVYTAPAIGEATCNVSLVAPEIKPPDPLH